MSLGITLKTLRQRRHLTQVQVATGLCAQSMLSAIEHDRYLPNAKLLLGLCDRLDLSLNTLSLATDFAISDQSRLNGQLQALCNQHAYRELADLLARPATLAAITTDEQTQAYYYYLGVAQLHTMARLDAAEYSLRFAAQMAPARKPVLLTRLAWATLAIVHLELGRPTSAHALMTRAQTGLDRVPYEENCQVIYYLLALGTFLHHDLPAATAAVKTTITYITAHHSAYMLANCYRLLAEIAVQQGAPAQAATATRQQRFLSELFHEPVPTTFPLSES